MMVTLAMFGIGYWKIKSSELSYRRKALVFEATVCTTGYLFDWVQTSKLLT